MTTNCINCGAPLDPLMMKCPYCGTYYFDCNEWNIENGKPCYIRFKINDMHVTALARPIIETMEVSSEPIYTTDFYDVPLIMYNSNKTCDINIRFHCIEDKKTKTLFTVYSDNR